MTTREPFIVDTMHAVVVEPPRRVPPTLQAAPLPAVVLPRYLTFGAGGSYHVAVQALVGLPDARVNAILNGSPYSELDRKALAADVLLARRQRQMTWRPSARTCTVSRRRRAS